MPTQKTRINLTVPKDVEKAVATLAKRDDTSVATKTLELLCRAIEVEEDGFLLAVAEARERTTKKEDYLTHADIYETAFQRMA